MKMNIARIKTGSMVDGPGGPRTVVWLQGCSIRCTGCQNWALWPKESSDMMSLPPTEAAALVLSTANGQPITITGGEPFDQPETLGPFVAGLKTLTDEPPHIIIYTGYRYEDLRFAVSYQESSPLRASGINLAMHFADVLVDGEYIARLDSPTLQWRGSANQRPIDLFATREDHAKIQKDSPVSPVLGWPGLPALLDWDTPTIEIVNGTLIATGGLLEELGLAKFGIVKDTPRCGEFVSRGVEE